MRQVHLGAHFPGAGTQTTIWDDHKAAYLLSTYADFGVQAEENGYDFFFMPEHRQDTLRPGNIEVLDYVKQWTKNIGIVGTFNATDQDRDLALGFERIGDRSGWNVVMSRDAVNLDRAEKYHRAESALLDMAHWPIEPVIFTVSSDSDIGRAFGARHAEVIYSRHNRTGPGRAFYNDMHNLLVAYGRRPESLLILPAATCVIGSTNQDAKERAHDLRFCQVTEEVAEQMMAKAPPNIQMQQLESGISKRRFLISRIEPQTFIGTAGEIAAAINHGVQTRAADGYILLPSAMPEGLSEFSEKVIPILQEMGVYRTKYEESFRENLFTQE